MGTSIDCIFAREVSKDIEKIETILDSSFTGYGKEIETISEKGYFSKYVNLSWNVFAIEEEVEEPAYIQAEGPLGFSIYIYETIVVVSSPERFFALHADSPGIGSELVVLFKAIAALLGKGRLFAFAAGGFGDSDQAIDLAYYQGVSFEEACGVLHKNFGAPAKTWPELSYKSWFLGEFEEPNKKVNATQKDA